MKNRKAIAAIFLICLTMLVSFVLPRPKYTSPDVLSKLNIPESFGAWRSRDVSSQVQTGGDVYNFVSRVFAREYARPTYVSLLDKGWISSFSHCLLQSKGQGLQFYT